MEKAALIGRRCKALVAREFWLDGRLVTEVSALFLQDDKKDVWKIYLDDEDYSWKLKRVQVMPKLGAITGDLEFSYPHVDIFVRFPLEDRVIENFTEGDLGTSAIATICFSNDQEFVLDYEYATERTTVRLDRR